MVINGFAEQILGPAIRQIVFATALMGTCGADGPVFASSAPSAKQQVATSIGGPIPALDPGFQWGGRIDTKWRRS